MAMPGAHMVGTEIRDGAIAMSIGAIDRLPAELLASVAHHLDPDSLLSLGASSRALCAVASDPEEWRERLWLQHSRILASLFDGSVPEPRGGRSWKQHFFDFSTSWKEQAMRRGDRLLLVIGSAEASPRGSSRAPHTFGVYDVTSYKDDHPGAEMLLLEAAEERDASGLFGDAWHSDTARRRLLTLAVPGLEALSREEALGPRCHRRHRSWWHKPRDVRSLASGLAALLVLLCVPALVDRLVDAPCLTSAMIGCAALRRWPWEACAGTVLAALALALRCGAAVEIVSFGRALCESPVLPGVAATAALVASLARDSSTAKSLVGSRGSL
tara:strand:+ start:974 stop:1957 length:984 start_codon:yes stop_codon:yes gene_type:complete